MRVGIRSAALKIERKAEGTEEINTVLPLVFLGPEYLGIAQSKMVILDSQACLKVAD